MSGQLIATDAIVDGDILDDGTNGFPRRARDPDDRAQNTRRLMDTPAGLQRPMNAAGQSRNEREFFGREADWRLLLQY